MKQPNLFDRIATEPSCADVIADAEAMARLRLLCSLAVKSSPGGWSMRRAWRAAQAWQSADDAEKASDAAVKRLQRSESWASMSERQRLDAMSATEPFVLYVFRLGRAERTILCADKSARITARDVEESSREIAAMCDTSAEVVVRFVMTGETP